MLDNASSLFPFYSNRIAGLKIGAGNLTTETGLCITFLDSCLFIIEVHHKIHVTVTVYILQVLGIHNRVLQVMCG